MKNFFKIMLAVFLGITLFFIVSVFVLIGVVGSSVGESSVELKKNTVFHLKLQGVLQERSSENFYDFTSTLVSPDISRIGLDELLSSIEKAAQSPDITGIYLECGLFQAAPASILEIREALLRFKETGKFLVAYADSYAQGVYHIASVADKVFLNPQGILEFRGLAMHTLFFKDFLDKIGVEMQVVKVGTFKSAVEPFILKEMSDANRQQMTKLSSSVWGVVLNGISVSRNVEIDRLNEFADKGYMFAETEKALEFGLVDSLLYEADMKTILENLSEKDYKTCSLKDMKKVVLKQDFYKDKIAVVYAAGGIDVGRESEEKIHSDKLTRLLLDLAEDSSVKSVVLRVNSPGGSAYGSEQIWNAVCKIKANKPIIVSMGDYAASGGYYIACAADTIVAQPNTLTGSIGIYGLIPNTSGLMQKIGVSLDVVKTNKLSDFASTDRKMSEEERSLMQAYVNRGYELFVKRCAEGRKMTIEQIKALAEGRVWSGEDALGLGLVDKLGCLEEAIAIAAEKSGLEKYRIEEYPAKKDFFTSLIEDFSTSMETSFLTKKLGKEIQYLEHLNTLRNCDPIQARMPFVIEMK